MNLKIAVLIINHLQVLRLQGFKARISIRGILSRRPSRGEGAGWQRAPSAAAAFSLSSSGGEGRGEEALTIQNVAAGGVATQF